MRDSMTKEDALEMLATLAAWFNVSVPKLRWNERTRNGQYSYRLQTISCGHLAWRGVTNSLLHEFSHHLACIRGDKGHGKGFKQALWDVVVAYFGNPQRYDWATEYVSVKAYGKRKISTGS